MKAAIKSGMEKFEIREFPAPEINDDECLVRVKYCAICVWCYNEWLRDGTDDIYGPGLTGHEVSGIIEKAGPKVKGWKAGDEVLVYDALHCGVCPECASGRETYCRDVRSLHKGYAQYLAAPAANLFAVPEGIKLAPASLITDMVGTSMHAIRRAFSVDLGRDTVTVWGLGPVGLFVVQGLRTFKGVKKIIGLDPVESRRKLALELGADEVVDTIGEGVEERLLSENGGAGVNYAFNCVTAPKAIETAYKSLRLNGYLMNITGSIKTADMMEKRVDGSWYFFKKEYEENVRLVLEGKIRLDPVISHIYPLSGINDAMEMRSKHPDKSLKVLINCT